MQLGLYKHYKGNLYQVIAVGRHSESLEEMVIYRALYGEYGIWVRPHGMFLGTVEHDGRIVQRFQFIKALDCDAPEVR